MGLESQFARELLFNAAGTAMRRWSMRRLRMNVTAAYLEVGKAQVLLNERGDGAPDWVITTVPLSMDEAAAEKDDQGRELLSVV